MDDARLKHLPPPDLLGTPSRSSLPSSTPADGSSLDVEAWAVEEAAFFVGLFQKDDAYEPATYGIALTGLFSMYPEHIVKKTTSLNGMVAEHESSWLPSIAAVRAYLEKTIRPEREAAAREARIKQQLADDEEWRRPRSPEEIARRRAKAEEWLRRPKPEQPGALGLDQIQQANERTFERECRADGIDPASAVASPSLRKLLTPPS